MSEELDAIDQINELIGDAEFEEPEIKEPPLDAPPPNETPPSEPNPIEDKARSSGWVSKEEWESSGKDPDQWVDAGEFVRRAPLFQELKEHKRRNKDLEKRLDDVAQYAAKAEEIGRQRALKELDQKRKEAITLGDVEAFEEADNEYQKLQLEKVAPPEPAVKKEDEQPQYPPEVVEFAKRNERWFDKDVAMTAYAVEQTRRYRMAGDEMSEAMSKAEADVKREFAHKFINPKKDQPSAVAQGSGEQRPQKHGYSSLNSAQRAVFATLKNVMTLDEYIDGLKKQGELK